MVPGLRIGFGSTVLSLVILAGCSDSSTAPGPQSRITISPPVTPAGSPVSTEKIGSAFFIARGSGRLSIPMTITSGREVPWAQLSVYLWDNSGGALSYCGQNMPDAPTWGPFLKGQMVSVEISGFQVFRVPCEVTAIKAWLHTRNNGLLVPPSVSETVAEGSLDVRVSIR